MSQFEQDLTKGSVLKRLIVFSLPFLLSNIVQSLYNVADMLIVGNLSGTAAMSGVNIGGQITFILTNLVFGLCTGGTVLIAQAMGAGRRGEMKNIVATLITGLSVIALVLTVVMSIFKDPLLRLIQTPEGSYQEASDYLLITLSGLFFIFGYNALSAILRGMGDSKRPFWFVLISCITNIVLDLLLVGPLKMGAMGAAIATVISQALSMTLCVIYLIRHDFIFDFKWKSFRVDRQCTARILRIGTPTAVQNTVVSLSFLFINSLANRIGMEASAAVGVVGKFNSFAIMPCIAMSAAISTMSAQNIGAGKWDRARKSCLIGMSIAVVFSYAIFVVAQSFPREIVGMFDSNELTIQNGVEYLRSFSLDYLIVPFVFCLNGLFVGAGHTTWSLLTGMVSSLVGRVPASYLLGFTAGLGIYGVGMGGPAATALSLLMNIIFLLTGRWKVNMVEKRLDRAEPKREV